MSEPQREYVECRLFILGDEKVGKKSFVKKILNLPSTSIIHNIEAEKDYDKLLSQFNEQIEQERQWQIQQQELLKSINNSSAKKDNDKTSRFASSKSLFRIDEEKSRSFSRKPSVNLGNKNITTSNNLQNSQNSSGIINMSSINSKKIFRPPVPEYPAKLYCVNLNKIVIKIFCIPKAEKRPYDFIPRDDDEEYVLEKEHNISFDGIKRDINEKMGMKDTVITQDKLYGFNTSVFTLFVFMYDLSSFYSFESLIIYYSKIAKLYHIGEEENFKACIVGNKIDKKILMEKEQENIFNEFLKNTHLKKFEISTKPFFLFDKFFIDFFIQNFSMFNLNQTESHLSNYKLFEDFHFIEQFKKLVKNKSNFARSVRSRPISSSISPGPEYNLNLYSFNSIEEIKDIFSNKKSRFTKKIFANKSGPILSNEKVGKDFSIKNKDKEVNFNIPIKGGLFNKPISGYSFGIINGRYNLVQKRKDLRDKRNMDLKEKIDSFSNSPLNKTPLKKPKDEEYFENVLKRRNNRHENIVKERQLKLGKILAIHNENLKKMELKNKILRNKILKNQNVILPKSNSSPNILFNSVSTVDEIRNMKKKRYHEIIYSKNKENLEKYNEKLSHIRLLTAMRRQPEPYYIDIRENMLNPQKGRSILEKFKIVENKEKAPEFQKLKDDFEKIAEKVSNFRPSFGERFTSPEKIRLQKEKEEKSFEEYSKKEEEKRIRWEKNRENSERVMKIKILRNDRREKLNKHNELMKSEQYKRDAIQELRREISIQKGYGDPTIINPINYSQVEESAPRYSIKGRYEVHEIRNDDPGNLILGGNLERLNYIKEIQKNEPLPNFNYIKRRLPRVIFNKAERFPKQKNQYEDSVLLFEDGIFLPNTHQDFICKEPMDSLSQRGEIISSANKKSPSPADYKIKSNFDKIVEEGEKISKIKNKIKIQNSMEIKRRENLKEKEEKNDESNNNSQIQLVLENDKKK